MPATLEQKGLFSKDTYTIEYNGIRFREQGFNKNFETFIQFENVPAGLFFRRIFNKNAIILCLFFVVIDAVYIVSVLSIISEGGSASLGTLITMIALNIISALVLWFTRQEYVGFGGNGQVLLFDSNRPSRPAVEAFMDQVRAARTTYLRDLYLNHAKETSPSESLQRLIWLKSMEAISDAEFEAEKRKLDQGEISNSGMGFRNQK